MKRATQTLLLLSLFSVLQFSLNAQSTQQIISNYLKQHVSDWSLLPEDVNQIEIVSESSSLAAGVTHVYIRQMYNDVPVVNGLATVTVKNGNVVHVTSNLVSLKSEAIAVPVLTAEQSISKACGHLGIQQPAFQIVSENATTQSAIYSKGMISNEDIPVRLFLMHNQGKLEYVWDLSIYPKGTQNWWSMRVSAVTGEILFQNNWMSSCSYENCGTETHAHIENMLAPAPPPPGMDQYTVLALPVESPNHGNMSTVINPSDATFSPYGWHDTDGQTGDEYTITRGNNVFATEDINDDNQPGYSPDGGASLDFAFVYDSLGGVEGNLNSVITNLFYMNNMMHDIWAYYGFDEASGNFQELNYSGEGNGSDNVLAEAQDGSGTDNANFGTPPDGSNPRMQMYLWNFSGYNSIISVNDPVSIAGSYPTGDANFGPHVQPGAPLTGELVLVVDGGVDTLDACESILNGPELNGKIALIRRGNCANSDKVIACQNFGAIAVVAMQPTSESPGSLLGSVPVNNPINIPAIIVGKSTGDMFIEALDTGSVVNVTITANGSPDTYDSDFDNMIIAHEYGHGISTRLVGGASNSNCLFNDEQMGEGWSDWFGLMLTIEPGDLGTQGRGVGTYVSGESVTGQGIRPARYSTNFGINNYTYDRTNNTGLSQPHGIGFVWCTMLWDLNWALIDEYGFDPDLKSGTGGNNIAMALVIEGLKLTSCGPGFVDARDGILEADEILYGGANSCLIWEVFAKRGLGYSADQGDNNSRTDQTEAFDVHPNCVNGLLEKNSAGIYVYPNPGTSNVTVSLSTSMNAQQLRVLDVAGKEVYTIDLTGDEKQVDLDLSMLNKGVYFIQVSDHNGSHTTEWIKN